jgi:hypothetical protein
MPGMAGTGPPGKKSFLAKPCAACLSAIMKGTVRQHHLFGRFVPLQIACECPTDIEGDEIK